MSMHPDTRQAASRQVTNWHALEASEVVQRREA